MKTSELMISSTNRRNDRVAFFDGTKTRVVALEEVPKLAKVSLDFSDKDLISYNFDLSKDLTDSEIVEAVEIKMFQEAGLNPMLDYKIVYSQTESRVDNGKVSIQAFAGAINSLEKQSRAFVDRVGFIDLILPTTSIPKVLYSSKILEPRNDIFLYFVKDCLFLSIFIDGNLVYGKIVDVGIAKLHDTFSRNTGEKLSYEDFVSLLVKSGVDAENYSLEDKRFAIDFTNLLNGTVGKINNVLQYSSRMFMLDTYSRVFVGTENGVIPGAKELFETAFAVETRDYLFYTKFFSKTDPYLDQRENLLLLELEKIVNKEPDLNTLNISINKRASSFLKRKSGPFISTIVLIVAIGLLVPLFFIGEGIYYSIATSSKLNELKLNKNEFDKFKNKERALKLERNQLEERLERSKGIYKQRKDLLDNLHDKRINKTRVIVFINDVFRIMSGFRVKILDLEYKDRIGSFSLESGKQDDITALIKKLVEEGYNVHMESVEFRKGLYESVIKVNIK